ncbi:HlyD family secretion protein [Falsiroseomonas oryziterrae]|uniref:HlyD family secretion protein n=1 Tax=Falsiroseomonas oryziterrae TaxID=2911368 RepID=UPI001F44C353|nr:HlyD family secretion protein [Roseomonas sp. NPKOSM-4]
MTELRRAEALLPEEGIPPAGTPPGPPPAPPPQRRSGRGIGVALIVLFLVALAVHVLLDRVAPYTSEATLQAPVVGLAPEVSGDIVDVAVRDNQQVRAGDVLFHIDPSRFVAAVEQAEANLASASQSVGASTAALSAAEAQVLEARANLVNAREQSARVMQLVERRVYAEAQADRARAQLASAQAGLQRAEADLEEARRRLGPGGADNPQIRAALAQLQRARIDLASTEVRAPVDGFVTNTVLAPGQFATAGHTVATIIDTESAWVVANLPENALGNIRPGDPAEITFNVAPGRIVAGRVESIAAGVTQQIGGSQPGLARVAERRRWLRDTQRIPVRIELLNREDIPAFRVGSRASVIVITQEAGAAAAVARLWLHIVATANYAF